MELEATILERLQELRRWQVQQQERLMKQQQEQREMLSYEQDRMYQALGLSVQGIVLDDSVAQRLSDSPTRFCSTDNRSEGGDDGDSSLQKCYGDSDTGEASIADREEANDASNNNNQLRMSLSVPPLQLNTDRYLNYKSSIDGFSPRSEIPSERQESSISLNSQRTPEKKCVRALELSIDGVEPLLDEKPQLKHLAIDDLPVPSPKKDFTTLLEERLRDYESVPEANGGQAKTVIKRPFLKKGEGLARFKPNRSAHAPHQRARPRSSSWSTNTHSSSISGTKGVASRLKDTPKSSKMSGSMMTRSVNVPPVAQPKLNLKSVPLPKKKVRSNSISASTINRPNASQLKAKASADMNNSSDFETKQRRELEEMRIFELLEEKAENSSFCSNSSTVLALFRQSTPLKPKSMQKNSRDPKQRVIADSTNNRESSDSSLEEIVRTTKSNRAMPGSPVTKIRETLIQKDIVYSKWDSGPFDDDNNDGNSALNNCNRGSQRGIATGSYKSTQHTKHTTIQFNNNNNNNVSNVISNNSIRKPVVHSDEEDACDISTRTNIDVAYDANYRNEKARTDDSPAENEGPNVSLHVRFSEYNEYKTIGLTDTSMLSNDANPTTRIYTEDKAWSDRSTSPESSDAELLFSKSKPIVCSTKSSSVKAALPPASRKDENRVYGDESTDQTTDDEQYTSTCSTDTSYDPENTISETNTEKRRNVVTQCARSDDDDESESFNDSGGTIKQENNEGDSNRKGIDSVDVNCPIFKSELLKTRLSELEREIEIFRKENAALANQRKKLQEEQRQLQKEFRQKEESLERERKIAEESMQEEKKRLTREKSALEVRLRDAREKSLQSKQERLEIQALREQIDELREDASQKESRWSAAQARQKSQIRVLQTENTRLKQELEKLRLSRSNNSRLRRPPGASNTRAIHQINKQLDGKKKINPKNDSSSDEETVRSRMDCREYEIEEIHQAIDHPDMMVAEVNNAESETIVHNSASQQSLNVEDDARKKRNLYTNLLNEATQGLRGREEITIGKSSNVLERSINQSLGIDRKGKEDKFESNSNESTSKRNLESSFTRSYENAIENRKRSEENVVARLGEFPKSPVARTSDNAAQQEAKYSPECSASSRNEGTDGSSAGKQDVREVICPDGHIEYWYPNGNVKKVFPDRNATKMIYYNGDVRENTEDGSVKYFYASTRTWHTTLPDGLEILEFPDGQVERRMKDGTIEVSFPDGSVRLLQADGTEKWVLLDGTIVETFPDGDKILSFSNGQREVHTKEHKRREYPDGTAKLIYPDGTQETRYSTGRVRVKDKDGNLIMDVHN